jgi:hypothetical protein
MMSHAFEKGNYYFLSYSSKDYCVVSKIRSEIENYGIKCWMAPRDIKAGTNYAHVIEIAIRNAKKFVLVLSESSIWSVWVEKELQRAIHHFQHDASNRIMPIWLDYPVDLDDTPMAYPLEGVQIIGTLSRGDNCRILFPEKIQKALKVSDKIENTLQNYNLHSVRISDIKSKLTKQLSIAYSLNRQLIENCDERIASKQSELNKKCDELKECIQQIKGANIRNAELYTLLRKCLILSDDIRQLIDSISKLHRNSVKQEDGTR